MLGKTIKQARASRSLGPQFSMLNYNNNVDAFDAGNEDVSLQIGFKVLLSVAKGQWKILFIEAGNLEESLDQQWQLSYLNFWKGIMRCIWWLKTWNLRHSIWVFMYTDYMQVFDALTKWKRRKERRFVIDIIAATQA